MTHENNNVLDMPEVRAALQAAEAATKAVGEFLAKRFAVGQHEVEYEGAHEKIQDDVVAEEMYIEIFRQYLPEFSYLSEETQLQAQTPLTFIIDPIEGTSNYLRGIPFFATQVAIAWGDELIASYIYEPVRDILYRAQKGQGSFANNVPIHVGNKTELKKATLSAGSGSKGEYKHALLEEVLIKIQPEIRSFRIYGSTGLELAHVASGNLDLHVNHHSKVYDYAAGVFLVQEAGGVVTTLDGSPWSLREPTVVAANPVLHQNFMNKRKEL